MDNFDLKKYLVENKRTKISKDLLIESVDFKENDKVEYQGKEYYVVLSATDNEYIEPNDFSKEFADAGTTKDSFIILSPKALEYGETLSGDQIKSALDFYIITDKSKVKPGLSEIANQNKVATDSKMLEEAYSLDDANEDIARQILAKIKSTPGIEDALKKAMMDVASKNPELAGAPNYGLAVGLLAYEIVMSSMK